MRLRAIEPWIWPVALAAVLWVLSGRPGRDMPEAPFLGFDKVLHLVAYFPLGLTLARALPGAPMIAILLGIGYGAVDEWHQSWVPYRTPSAGDLVADAIGVVLGVVAWRRHTVRASAVG